MSKAEVRRAQLVSTFGPGAMQVIRDGISVITSGLDHWFSSQYQTELSDDREFRIEEKRLARRLGVDFFMLPPDWRKPDQKDKDKHNIDLTIPVMRFPQWHVCSTPSCHSMRYVSLHERTRQIECETCRKKGRFSPMHQVRFVVACEDGHLSDFPWNEWAHGTASPECDGQDLRLHSSGSSSLASLKVSCRRCNSKPRSLAGTTNSDGDSSFLSKSLESGILYTCRGHSPWLGNYKTGQCQKPIRAAVRGASNIYFADMVSSLLLPTGDNTHQELIDLITTTPSIQDIIENSRELGASDLTITQLLKKKSLMLIDYSEQDILHALSVIAAQESEDQENDNETLYRYEEHKRLRAIVEREKLRVEPVDVTSYEPWFTDLFDKVSLVHRLTETRALSGFFRLNSNNNMSRSERIKQLRRHPAKQDHLWLPACQVYGEGIYLELSKSRIDAWMKEHGNFVGQRLQTLHTAMAKSFRHFDQLTAEYVLLHTLAHVLINQLVFECGYSSASLRERLYYPDPEQGIDMAGILVYTAAGDSEGSMGGLVNMGRPGNLEEIVRKALDSAGWCSSDPVCMEAAAHGGQGPESLNLAACHACALLPETSCEAFNCLLDRGLLVGGQSLSEGYFSNLF